MNDALKGGLVPTPILCSATSARAVRRKEVLFGAPLGEHDPPVDESASSVRAYP